MLLQLCFTILLFIMSLFSSLHFWESTGGVTVVDSYINKHSALLMTELRCVNLFIKYTA